MLTLASAIHRQGSVDVDNWYTRKVSSRDLQLRTFDKIVDGDQNALVVFQEQSWKEIKDFEKVVQDLRDRADLIIVRVDGTRVRASMMSHFDSVRGF